MLLTPKFIPQSITTNKKTNYKWNTDIGLHFMEIENIKLFNAINQSNLTAKYAIGLATTEWIIWSYINIRDMSDEIYRIESAWAGLINPIYVKDLEYEMKEDDDKEPIEGPIELSKYILNQLYTDYFEESEYIASTVVTQVLLARHIVSDKAAFNTWLECVIKSSAIDFSKNTSNILFRNNFTNNNISSNNMELCLKKFTKSLNSKKNKYLNSQEELLKSGFNGVIYD